MQNTLKPNALFKNQDIQKQNKCCEAIQIVNKQTLVLWYLVCKTNFAITLVFCLKPLIVSLSGITSGMFN